MGKTIRIVTTNDPDYKELRDSGQLATGIDPHEEDRKAELDEDGNLIPPGPAFDDDEE